MLKILYTHAEMFAARAAMQGTIGFVPTMGFLHQGHLSLVRRAVDENDHAIVSIFVNPTQFGPAEDLSKYPRDLERDLAMISELGNVLVWIPDAKEMYPDNFQTWVEVEGLTKPLEGEMRPGHFRGVTTVVAKLFNAVQPSKAYFGQKDFQQAAVIGQMARDLSYPTKIVVCPTMREADGLAMSSRNSYLNPQERAAAPVLWQALQATGEAYAKGERDARVLVSDIENRIKHEPLAKIQYVRCSDALTLADVEGDLRGPAVISLAVFFGATRLIDNILLG